MNSSVGSSTDRLRAVLGRSSDPVIFILVQQDGKQGKYLWRLEDIAIGCRNDKESTSSTCLLQKLAHKKCKVSWEWGNQD